MSETVKQEEKLSYFLITSKDVNDFMTLLQDRPFKEAAPLFEVLRRAQPVNVTDTREETKTQEVVEDKQ